MKLHTPDFRFDAGAWTAKLAAVLHRVSRCLIVSALILVLGLHWALLQSVAWVGMIVEYSNGTTLKEAVSKTFNGHNPCKLCKFIQSGKAAEKKETREKSAPRIECAFLTRRILLFPPVLESLAFPSSMLPAAYSDAPPLPPPKLG